MVRITPENGPRLVGWYGLSPIGLRAILDKQSDDKRDAKKAIEHAQTGERVAQEKQREAETELAKALWWKQNGPLLLIGVAAAAACAGAAVGFEIQHPATR